ncbi:helix-turn-helix domain-containing protein [Devosia sp. BK]|uniref:helix-turn-helix domain-containing protein n=1 Tax=Devosia sp. BK TaxID=2871706 RepID=UPI00293A18DB|nr:helix-turn-helix domain-containing protein [Devosia sp. BK]MDV3253561.1 helix-turn-helix domain-containing protein [Devosia sp. BK]
MTMPAFAQELGGRLPSDGERAAANQLRKLLAAQSAGDAKLRVVDEETRQPTEITLTPGLSNLLMELLRHVGRGDAVTLVPVSQMLTTQQAADILNVSRPFLISLLEKGDIEFTSVGRHRRVKAEHLFEYKRKRDERRSGALSDLAAEDAEYL